MSYFSTKKGNTITKTPIRRWLRLGKKHRNRINSPKKNNHIPPEQITAEHEAHAKEYSAKKRKNS